MKKNEAGLTLLEVVVTTAVTMIIIASVLTLGSDAIAFASFADSDANVQNECNRSYHRLTEVLRKSGWSTLGGTSYPRVINDGEELQFRLLADLDGNGYLFDATTGDLEWSTTIYSVRVDPDTSMLNIYDPDGNVEWVLGQNVTRVLFSTYLDDNTIPIQQVQMQIAASKLISGDVPLSYVTTGNIHMRN